MAKKRGLAKAVGGSSITVGSDTIDSRATIVNQIDSLPKGVGGLLKAAREGVAAGLALPEDGSLLLNSSTSIPYGPGKYFYIQRYRGFRFLHGRRRQSVPALQKVNVKVILHPVTAILEGSSEAPTVHKNLRGDDSTYTRFVPAAVASVPVGPLNDSPYPAIRTLIGKGNANTWTIDGLPFKRNTVMFLPSEYIAVEKDKGVGWDFWVVYRFIVVEPWSFHKDGESSGGFIRETFPIDNLRNGRVVLSHLPEAIKLVNTHALTDLVQIPGLTN